LSRYERPPEGRDEKIRTSLPGVEGRRGRERASWKCCDERVERIERRSEGWRLRGSARLNRTILY
jgi:hypothetical protein